ncbi:hypothetical protein GCM10010387_00160 [Streptomyces inusitatus]|uniref:Uncharacterized protein n=1 Tax=Streptomyces inusitatus TaxID=68221 RepID=A0A918PJ84_9ACTN|nr:hypothetical protein [Streptomyces inusitatus]GGZ12280.1 hypothetical protein GCM10010387_00160 [Streptomyces inusitatus]
MNGPVEPRREYRCDVIAEGAVYGTAERAVFVLAATVEISPRQALLWMCNQARRIADRLDPDPARVPWGDRVPEEPADGQRPDGPTRLRDWARDYWTQKELRTQLREGAQVSLTVADGANGVFRLRARPVAVRSPRPDLGEIPAGPPFPPDLVCPTDSRPGRLTAHTATGAGPHQ